MLSVALVVESNMRAGELGLARRCKFRLGALLEYPFLYVKLAKFSTVRDHNVAHSTNCKSGLKKSTHPMSSSCVLMELQYTRAEATYDTGC